MFFSCASVKNLSSTEDLGYLVGQSEILQDQYIGYVVYDPQAKKSLLSVNSDKYFTPASNTKLFTLYASMMSLRDSIPTFAYSMKGNNLVLDPLGDPTFVHPDFESQRAVERLKEMTVDSILIRWPEKEAPRYGPGWSWDDYDYSYQVERTALPMYGNVLSVTQIDSSTVTPAFFTDFVDYQRRPEVYRDRYQNIFHVPQDTILGDTTMYRIPIQNNRELTELLLTQVVGKPIGSTNGYHYPTDTLYNGPTTPLLALMTQRSDNFLAEQLLAMSAQLSRSDNVESHISKLGKYELAFLPDSLIWVDGSGLSRYNMITPRNLVGLLERMYNTWDWPTLQSLLPTGGVNGTIRSWYGASEPYVFAKTGTLRHNHCLSGYIKTKSGKVLIFSFMNNHFTRPTSDIKGEMQRLLETIRDNY